ncbi:MAG: DNA-directed DNA polymerase II small subunit [Candidatus Thermoplasmatota archaeon]|nr:DNA-directed DNA polymerase II small subunit [Candidatus Thermoplasmatota archaeon]
MKSIIQLFSEHGTLIQPDTLEYLLSKNNPEQFCENIANNITEYPLVLTINHVKEAEQQLIPLTTAPPTPPKPDESVSPPEENEYGEIHDQKILTSTSPQTNSMPLTASTMIKEPIYSPSNWHPDAKDYDSDIKIIQDITGNSISEGTTADFAKLFADRFDVLRNLLRGQRRELSHVIPIKRVKKAGLDDIQLIGIVENYRTTKNGHIFLELEDDSDTLNCIVLKNNRDAFPLAEDLVLDEIIGITGNLSKHGDLFLVDNIIYPDISLNNRRHKANAPIHAAFLSDIHIGSKEFMGKQWNAFLKWINGNMGNSRQKQVAGKIKYLIIPGDIVDGIGVYPNQDKELSIVDLYKQYEALATELEKIPDHISMIIQPGNHDAVRPAEPQPAFDKNIQKLFHSTDATFIGNPAQFSIHSVEILSYHGQSLMDFATNIQRLKYNEPVEVMKVMLQKHHLAPMYGGYTPLAPEHKDYMIINRVPDIFVTGHVHLANLGEYRGVTLVNASSWQAQTSYQKMLNFIPDPAKLPIADLQHGKVTMMDFNKQI